MGPSKNTGHVLQGKVHQNTRAMSTEEAELTADFEAGESGSSETYPQQCSALRKGGYVMIKGRPCKICEMSTSKTGKHGHAKVHLVALDIFNGQKKEDMSPSTHNLDVPRVKRTDYQYMMEMDDKFCQMMADDGEMKEDLRIPDDAVGDEIREKEAKGEQFLVTVLSACDEEKIVGVKALTK